MMALRFELSVFRMHIVTQAHERLLLARLWTSVPEGTSSIAQITNDYKPFALLSNESLYILKIMRFHATWKIESIQFEVSCWLISNIRSVTHEPNRKAVVLILLMRLLYEDKQVRVYHQRREPL